jgi:signal transduction histidine kinase
VIYPPRPMFAAPRHGAHAVRPPSTARREFLRPRWLSVATELDVNRISQGKVQLRRRRVELITVVHAAVETARSLIERMGHELTLAVPPEPVWVNADPLRLAQVVGNPLNNASKFTENGGCIGLTVAHRGEEAEIRVRDNGAGIGADQLPFVFDMFMQAEASIERSGMGLGIGLALVKNLVEMHGGTVEAHSAGAGHGSEFVVRLPVTHERSGRRKLRLTRRARPQSPVASWWSMTIAMPPSRSRCSLN